MKKQTIVVAALIASFALWGIFEALADTRFTRLGGTLSFVHVVLISGLIFWWATLDSESRSRSLSTGWKAALVLLGIVSVPFYLYSQRQVDRRWLSIAKGLALLVTACVLYTTSYVLAGA